jgi:hypothetical protein
MSAPQLGQVSGKDSNSRVSSMAQRYRAAEPDALSSRVAVTTASGVGTSGLLAASRP